MGNAQAPKKPKHRVDSRICVLGAGPAGMSAAYYLAKKGYKDVTIIERESRVGGKCHSFEDENGAFVDMGAVEVTANYKNVIAILKELKMDKDLIGLLGVEEKTIDRESGKVEPIEGYVKITSTDGHQVYETLGLKEAAIVSQAITYLEHLDKYKQWIEQAGCHNCPPELGIPFAE